MKILLADDEVYVRYGLKSILLQIIENAEIKEVENGEELLDAVFDFQPDIIFADIKMPKMSGIEALKKSKGRIASQWIILSGYSDFEYARACIKYDEVVDYLLKPVNPKELKEVLERASEKKRLKNRELQRRAKNDLLYFLYNGVLSEANIKNGDYIAADVILADGNSLCNYELIEEGCENICNERTKDGIFSYWVKFRENIYILAYELSSQYEIKRSVAFYLNSLRHQTENICLTSYSTDICDSFDNFYKQIQQILNLKYFRLLYCLAGCSKVEDLRQQFVLDKNNHVFFAEQIEIFVQSEQKKDFIGAVSAFRKLEEIPGNQIKDIMEKSNIIKYLGVIYPDIMWRTDDLFYGLNIILEKVKNESSDMRGSELINIVKKYIDHNYQKPITVQWLADKFHVTPNYLSNRFKKETSFNIVKYINQMRITEGEYLLRKTDLSVGEIAEKVGFTSTRYFTKIFMKQYQCYPTDIRRKGENGDEG